MAVRRLVGGSAALAVVATALLALATPASAHVPTVSAACTEGKTTLTVHLTKYNGSVTNTVKVTDGTTVLDEKTFTTDYNKVVHVSGAVTHVFTVEVHAGDDPTGSKHFSFTDTRTVEACVQQPTTTTVPPTTTTESTAPTTTESTTTELTSVAPTTSPAPGPDDLANTGVSLAVPLSIGAVLLLAGGLALVLTRRRNRA